MSWVQGGSMAFTRNKGYAKTCVKGVGAAGTFRNFLRVVWKRPVRRDCSEMAAYAAMVLEMVPRCPVFVVRKAVNSRGSQFLLKACRASTFLHAVGHFHRMH